MLAITGANGHLGRRLLKALDGRVPLRALVRSERAALQIRQLKLSVAPEIEPVDYLDPASMKRALTGCSALVHLVGIIKENAANSYREAHEESSQVLSATAAQAGVTRLVYLSILGAAPDSANACLASRGRAEVILRSGAVPVLILRVPMVLGEDDYASRALARRARRRLNVLLRGDSLEQPIYGGDVVRAIEAGLGIALEDSLTLELAGPESLSRRALTRRAAATVGGRTRVISLPLFVGMMVAGALERVSENPPVTRPMLGVLDHDDRIDPSTAARRLGVELTPLSQTLQRCLT